MLSRWAAAVTHYIEALSRRPPSINPNAHLIYCNLAACYIKMNQYRDGLEVSATS